MLSPSGSLAGFLRIVNTETALLVLIWAEVLKAWAGRLEGRRAGFFDIVVNFVLSVA